MNTYNVGNITEKQIHFDTYHSNLWFEVKDSRLYNSSVYIKRIGMWHHCKADKENIFDVFDPIYFAVSHQSQELLK